LLLPRAGHLPMLTRPDEFNRAIAAFLGGEPVGE
jgi:pimeloyl-ACP methyl ester carboxylesterase